MTLLTSLALTTLLAQTPAPAERDYNAPPEGAPADQQLWRELRAATNAAVLHMGRIAQCSFRISYGKYYEGLDAIAADAGAPDRDEARTLREGIASAAKAAQEAIPEKPGVRECHYVLRDLDLSMPLAATDRKAARMLKEARAGAKKCVKRLDPLAATMKGHADALEAALAAADAFSTRRGTPFVTLGADAPAGGAPARPEPAKDPAGAQRGPAPAKP